MNVDNRSERTRRDLRAAFEASGMQHPTPLSPELYTRARLEGFGMLGYVTTLPSIKTGVDKIITRQLTSPYPRFDVSTTGRWPCRAMKHVGDRQCGGKDAMCLPGKSGLCVACAGED